MGFRDHFGSGVESGLEARKGSLCGMEDSCRHPAAVFMVLGAPSHPVGHLELFLSSTGMHFHQAPF